MAQSYNVSTQAALDAGDWRERDLVLFTFGGGSYGFWTGLGSFVHETITYVGAGTLLEVDDVDQDASGAAISLTLKLSSIPNSELTPDKLNLIEAEVYHFRPVKIMTAFFHPDTNALLSVETIYRGIIDHISHVEMVGGEQVLMVYCESRALLAQKTGYRKRDHQDQKLVNSSDHSLRFSSQSRARKIIWGRAEPDKKGDKKDPKPKHKPKHRKGKGR